MIDLIIQITVSAINAIILCLLGYKFLQILQLSDYKLAGYVEWAKDTKANYLGRMLALVFLSFACTLVFNACLCSYWKYLTYIGLIPYVIFSIMFILNIMRAKKKTPLKSTYRMNRLVTTLFIICAGASYGLLQLSDLLPEFLHETAITLSPILLVFLVPLAHVIIYPFEELNKLRHIHIAKAKLKKYPYLIKIGITGSYGKTSTKYILNTLLSNKYNVCMSPHSFNTAMGLCRVVDKYLQPYDEVLITEMGASTCGDIAFLCGIIEPQMGIVTGVGNQHLRTFYSRNNIKNTKYELVKHIEKKENGFMVFNGENDVTKEFYDKCKCEKIIVGLHKEDNIYATDIKTSVDGTSFTMVYNQNKYPCNTKLVGEHNVQNILMATAIALKLDVTMDSIVESIKELEPTAHRLEIKQVNNYTVLDDSYNCSVEGYKSALNVLKLFDGKKIIITPGLVELGNEEKEVNRTFGKDISQVCDICVVVNKANSKEIIEGIQSNEQSTTQIIEAINLDDAKIKVNDFIEDNCCILFENDLPDNYM